MKKVIGTKLRVSRLSSDKSIIRDKFWLRASRQRFFALQRVTSEIAYKLLQTELDNLEDALDDCLQLLGVVAGVDKICLWHGRYQGESQEITASHGLTWIRAEDDQVDNYPEITAQDLLPMMLPWLKSREHSASLRDCLAFFNTVNHASLSLSQCQSLLLIPLHVPRQAWGAVCFIDYAKDSYFSTAEERILRTCGLLMTQAYLNKVRTLEQQQIVAKIQGDLERTVADLQNASHAKSNFLSNMSHEMRTPMTAITGMTTIGKRSAAIGRKDYAFDKIEEASNYLLGVINDVLDLSKIEANKFELSVTEFEFELMLQKAVGVINFRFVDKQQHFSIAIDERVPRYCFGDEQRLSQVVTNLLSNATKFTPRFGSIRLSIRYLGEENGFSIIEFSVSDTGIGISKEQQTRLFNSFEQAESSTSRKYGGTGLGLAISKHIVELMQGAIWVVSEPDLGSTFSFKVKLGKSANQEEILSEYKTTWSNLRLLAVDSDADTLQLFLSVAERYNAYCDTAKSGEAALTLLRQKGPYDICFIDKTLLDMTGLELADRIDSDASIQTSIVLTTTGELSEEEELSKSKAIQQMLIKPLLPSMVVNVVNSQMGPPNARAVENGEIIDDFEGVWVLLAEDVEINREIVIALLEPNRVSFDCVENGLDAVNMFQENPTKYAMIFMDVQMPEMDGLEATRQIRSMNNIWAKTIPIIALTANVFKEDIAKCLAAGMSDHLGKPLHYEDVVAKMKEHLPQS